MSLYTETLKDKFTLSPLQKYQKYGRWPYKLVLSCLLVVLTSIQSVYVSNHFIYNNPDLMQTWVSIFLKTDDSPQFDYDSYYTLKEFQREFSQTLENLAQLEDIAVIPLDVTYVKLFLRVHYNYPTIVYTKGQENFTYPLTVGQNVTSPFDLNNITSMKEFFKTIDSFDLEIRNITVMSNNEPSCWDITIKYKYLFFGYLQSKLESLGGVCAQDYRFSQDIYNASAPLIEDQSSPLKNPKAGFGGFKWNQSFIQISIIIIATLDLILNIKYIYEVMEMYTKNVYLQTKIKKIRIPEYKIKKDENLTTLRIILKQQKPWQELSYRERMLFFDLYLPLRILGNFFQIIASGIILAEGFFRVDNLANFDEMLVGFGCFMAWFSIAKYMEYIGPLRLIVSVLEASVVPLIMAVISFIPIFMAYLFLGMTLFGESSRFSSVHSSTVSLVALVYGDSVSDIVIEASMQQNLKISMLYIITYILFFIFAVNNIMVALIREQQDQRKEIIDLEMALMNELDIKPVAQNISSPFVPRNVLSIVTESAQEERSLNLESRADLSASIPRSAQELEDPEKKHRISLKTVTKLAILLNRNKGKERISQKKLEQDYMQLAGQEIKKNYIYNGVTECTQSIKQSLSLMEKEVLE